MDSNDLVTFGDISASLLKRIVNSSVVYFVTDQYKQDSIKSFERERRGLTGTVRMKVERRDQTRPKQWKKFLLDPKNKTELIRFILDDWRNSASLKSYLVDRTLFFNVDSKFYKLTCKAGEEVIYKLMVFKFMRNISYSTFSLIYYCFIGYM